MKKKIFQILLLFAALASCKKDENQFDFSISNITHKDSGILIEWYKINMNGFNYYEILRSINGSHFETINNIDSLRSDAFDIEKTTFIDYSYPLEDVIYYKISAVGDNNVFVSKKVSINAPEPHELTFIPSNAYLMPDKSQILFFKNAWSDSYIYLYDYNNNNILAQKNLDIKTTGHAYGFGKLDNSYEFYFNDGRDDYIKIYNLPEMQEVAEIYDYHLMGNFISDNNGFIYYPTTWAANSLNRENLELNTFKNNSISSSAIFQYSESLNCIWSTDTYSASKIVRMDIDNNGNIIRETTKEFEGDLEIEIIPNSNLAYYTKSKTDWETMAENNSVYVINMEDFSTNLLLDENNDTISLSTFCVHNDILYATDKFLKKVYCYSISNNMSYIKEFSVRISPRYMFVDKNNYLILIEDSDFNQNPKIDKMKLE